MRTSIKCYMKKSFVNFVCSVRNIKPNAKQNSRVLLFERFVSQAVQLKVFGKYESSV